ncbi:BnaC06g42420D [Brassica napus]|uniref:BnaC06g42420D protein n=1 Tax=Brassica napus TaxID=3708 RepID=A0A078I5M7_BRANA|nr:BnaC06g42420D [Brassica napus]
MASSDLYIFDGSFSSSDMFSSGTTTTDLFCNNELYSVDESLNMFDHFTPHILSPSLPSGLLGTLTLSPQIPTGLYPDFSDGRSFSTNSVDGKPNQIPFNNVPIMDSLNLHFNGLKSPENDFFSGQVMRRVYSTGDLQNPRKNVAEQRSSEPFQDEQNIKVGRYSAEERKEKISKYRAKRNHRNFTKTIKYACRKTLADSRPRIRGRFARNDEVVEIPNIEDDDTDALEIGWAA